MGKASKKKETLMALLDYAENGNIDLEEDYDIPIEDLLDFLENEISLLDRKYEKEKQRHLDKQIAMDKLRAAVKSALSTEFQTCDEIVSKVMGEGVSKAKVVSRLTSLIDNEEAIKERHKTEEGGYILLYKLKD